MQEMPIIDFHTHQATAFTFFDVSCRLREPPQGFSQTLSLSPFSAFRLLRLRRKCLRMLRTSKRLLARFAGCLE